ncbi:ATP-dependent nuclease [Sphingomonas sp. CFBP 13706]|uniref:ATP-dependent nuclease n=1 Tax=Sphingomonas sp. CFBP 13706 TaxID=2775314 RepID=UPI00177E57CC|nr:AAA family ATPase [Sphingomonas sp. CFBP 13706]MBD8737614.1 AAA family ATPase [Sphingomonas sp. CFBP 13706]
MRLSTVFARFYKSFNYDRIRKARPDGKPRGDWEVFRGQWFPYVEVRIDERLTTVVGANESGKSHLLSAIEKAVSGKGFVRRDLCRYSEFFGVTEEEACFPHLGVAWSGVTPEEWEGIRNVLGLSGPTSTTFMMFREGPDLLTVWTPLSDGWQPHELDQATASRFATLLPATFRIHSDVALPDSVPFSWIVSGNPAGGRRIRPSLLDRVSSLTSMVGGDASSVSVNAVGIFGVLRPLIDEMGQNESAGDRRALDLARSLLVDLAGIDPVAVGELANAIADGAEGYANALVERINAQIEQALNFRRWWVQDRDFSLRVATREHDLVFTIRDRTGTEYTFAERSSGLKYFLSYLIQSQAHRPITSERILLMDEPDTYLSAEAQQDLMRILRDLSEDQPDRPAVQVVYVTHSPFLIDKNHAERIRVLEKGRGRDGTLVVDNAAQNHYEPLRSAFGAYVGETAFVGSANLLVEGVTEQVLLAGASRAIRKAGRTENESLDLNGMVIVPCGSASHVPYMVHLVRGRDAEKPPVIVLLDSDGAGDDALKLLKRKPLSGLLPADLVLQLGKVAQDVDGIAEIEDMLPAALAAAAANLCLRELALHRSGAGVTVTPAELEIRRAGVGLFDRLDEVLEGKNARVEKLPFARAVVKLCEDPVEGDASDVAIYLDRMAKLFIELNKMRRKAETAAGLDRLSQLVDREQQLFAMDHKRSTTREEVENLLEKIEGMLDSSIEAEAIQRAAHRVRRKHGIEAGSKEPVADFSSLMSELAALKDALRIERTAEVQRLETQRAVTPDSSPAIAGDESSNSTEGAGA